MYLYATEQQQHLQQQQRHPLDDSPLTVPVTLRGHQQAHLGLCQYLPVLVVVYLVLITRLLIAAHLAADRRAHITVHITVPIIVIILVAGLRVPTIHLPQVQTTRHMMADPRTIPAVMVPVTVHHRATHLRTGQTCQYTDQPNQMKNPTLGQYS